MTGTVVIFNTSGPFVRQPFALRRSEDIANAPVAVRLLGRDLVLWRSPSGSVVAAPDQCTHSRGILSDGEVRDGRLICPNHGWAFGEAGRCVAKPTSLPIADKHHLKSFPCIEQYGLIWVALGEPTANVVEVPWDRDDRYRRALTEASVWRSNPVQILEELLVANHSPTAEVAVDLPFVVHETLVSERGAQHHRMLACAPIDVRSSLVTEVLWTKDGIDEATDFMANAAADLVQLRSAAEARGLQLPTVEISRDDSEILTDWKSRLLASMSS